LEAHCEDSTGASAHGAASYYFGANGVAVMLGVMTIRRLGRRVR